MDQIGIPCYAKLSGNVTAHPNAAWTLQQFREALSDAHGYRFPVRDRDGIYSRRLDLGMNMKEMGSRVLEVKSSPHASRTAARHLRDLQLLLDKPLRKAMVLSMDREERELGPGVLALSVAWLLGCDEGR